MLPAEQEVDGEALVMLHKYGTTEQLIACGLTTIKSQMKFKKAMFAITSTDHEATECKVEPAKDVILMSPKRSSGRHKLTKAELNKISAEEQRMYLRM